MFPKIIGVGGVAGAGKDLFFNLLSQKVTQVKRFALADELKEELRQFIIDKFNIDITNCSRSDKELVRPLLIAHGMVRRTNSQGKYWTSILENQIKNEFSINPSSIICVTDIRYNVYKEDEVFWLKEKMGGKLIHISTYNIVKGKKIFIPPNNIEEEKNDSSIKANADFTIEWPRLISSDNQNPNFNELMKYVDKIIELIK